MKKFRLSSMSVLLIITALIILNLSVSGCSSVSKETTQTPSNVSQPENNIQEIKKSLDRADIYGLNESPDHQYVAYVQGDSTLLQGQLYIWKVGESNSKPIEGVNERIRRLYWSPSSEYLFVDIGTSAKREGIIVTANEGKTIGKIGYSGGPCWSPDSKWIALGMVNNNIEAITPTELGGIRDLVLYNITTKEIKKIAKATNKYDFNPTKWDNDGKLQYEKTYYGGQPTEILVYSINSPVNSEQGSNTSTSKPSTQVELNTTKTDNPMFFKGNVFKLNYKGKFIFDNAVEKDVTLHIHELAKLKFGYLYDLIIDSVAGVPSDRLLLGFFYVQQDKIIKIEATQENFNKLTTNEELLNNSVVVCQDKEIKDNLSQNKLGWHQYITVNGDIREYHSFNNQGSSGYYESFTWEKNRGLINYRSGYGAERDSIELQINHD